MGYVITFNTIPFNNYSSNSLAEIAKGNITVPRGKGKASAEKSDSTNGEESIVSRKRNLEEEELALQKRVSI